MKKLHRKSLICAGIMGLLTILLCLVISDGIFGLNQPPAGSKAGIILFWVSLVALPLLFYNAAPWRYTLLNIPLYFLLYFPLYELFGLKHTHLFLETGGFIEFPVYWNALLVTVIFWGIQSLVYMACKILLRAVSGK